MFRTTGLAFLLCTLGTMAVAADVPGDTSSAVSNTDVLSSKVKEYQQAKNCDGMLGLFYTEGVEQRRKDAFTKTIREKLCGNMDKKIASIAFQSIPSDKVAQPGDFEGKHSVYTLQPVGAMIIDYGAGKPGDTRSIGFRYGIHDNKAYLITTKNADAK